MGGFFFEDSMAVVGIQPFIHVEDSNGDPIVGAKLHVYEVNTTTYRAIYSDSDLTTPLSNPLSGANASDASGNFPVFYMAAGEYKLRAVTSADVLIWQKDDLDTGLSAGTGALPISRGGTGATTAAAARAALDVPSNSELADLAADVTTLSSSVQSIVSQPQGRLTPTTGTPVISTSVSAGTAVYYTPYVGNLVPVYDGTQFNLRSFSSDLTLTLNSNHVASALYDVYVYWDGSALQIATGVAWNTATAGSGARGAGAGTTELERINGLWVNKHDISRRNGATTGTIDARKGTYVGSIFMDGTNGQLSCHVAWGSSRKFGVWNAYNRVPILLKAGDSTASWNNPGATWRQSNAATGNVVTVFAGLAEEAFDLSFIQKVLSATNASTTTTEIGIGVNSTTAISGRSAMQQFVNNAASVISITGNLIASHILPAAIGIQDIKSLEQAPSGTTNNTYYGTEANMILAAKWRG